ncbi:MAG: AAA family ATPase [Actinomycetota bacterium]
MPEVTRRRRGEIVRGVFEVLADEPNGLQVLEVIERVRELVPPTPFEVAEWPNHPGQQRYGKHLRFHTIVAVKAGWLVKEHGIWRLTSEGREALRVYADPEEFQKTAEQKYNVWVTQQSQDADEDPRWEVIRKILDAIPKGAWTSYGDIGEVVGLNAQGVGWFMSNRLPQNGHRVLTARGKFSPDFHWADPEATDDPKDVLVAEGVRFDDWDRAVQAQRLNAAQLRKLIGLPPLPQRGWLVRGASVAGRNLVPAWLEEGFCSLAATHLPPVEPGIGRDELERIVEESYTAASYNERAAKVNEFFALLSRMRADDVVVATSEGKVYLGVITGEAIYAESPGGRSNLRRPVEWRNTIPPINVADLAPPLPARLSVQHDVVDLTDQVEVLLGLMGGSGNGGSDPQLPDATEEFAHDLLVDHAWLQDSVELLRDRRQLIYYGPPGTGKTYIAQELARHLAGRENTKLVQFHPAYSYEDFFEGYRPKESADGSGSIGFKLTPGPLRRVVDQARQHPEQVHVLIVDEINRANLAKVFGELYFLLEYRDEAIELLYSSEEAFTLPKNVYLIGTMNTADRSIALVDSAMRRRFAFVSLHPSDEPVLGLLRRWLQREGLPIESSLLLQELNRRIEDTDFKIGPSYLMRRSIYSTSEGLDRVWRSSFMPLLEEHHYGQGKNLEQLYGLVALRMSLARASQTEAETVPTE